MGNELESNRKVRVGYGVGRTLRNPSQKAGRALGGGHGPARRLPPDPLEEADPSGTTAVLNTSQVLYSRKAITRVFIAKTDYCTRNGFFSQLGCIVGNSR